LTPVTSTFNLIALITSSVSRNLKHICDSDHTHSLIRYFNQDSGVANPS